GKHQILVTGLAGSNAKIKLAIGPDGSVYLSDYGTNVVRRLERDGSLKPVAGTGRSGFSGDGGDALKATVNEPRGLVVDSRGTLYFADSLNLRVRKVDLIAGKIDTVAGNGGFHSAGDNGPPSAAVLNTPSDVRVDRQGNTYIADTGNNRIRVITGDVITTI